MNNHIKKITKVKFTLSFSGGQADSHLIDMYDMTQALIGFQRSIALTTHFALNNKTIVQKSNLKDVQILASPSKEGSWEITAIVAISTAALILPNNTTLGHIIFSVYDYVIKKIFGFHVDCNKPLLQSYKEHQLNSLAEKCRPAISKIHSPIKTESVTNANITGNWGEDETTVGENLNTETYQRINGVVVSDECEVFSDRIFFADEPEVITGRIYGYDPDSLKGLIYVNKEKRTVEFQLSKEYRMNSIIELITVSHAANATRNYSDKWSTVSFHAIKNTTPSGRLKSYTITGISDSITN